MSISGYVKSIRIRANLMMCIGNYFEFIVAEGKSVEMNASSLWNLNVESIQ